MDALREELSQTSIKDLRSKGMRLKANTNRVQGAMSRFTKRSGLTDRYGNPLTENITLEIPQSVLRQRSGRWSSNTQDLDALIRDTASSRRSR